MSLYSFEDSLLELREELTKLPILMEFTVLNSPPFLVTSSKGLVWAPSNSTGVVRAASRAVLPEVLFQEILESIKTESLRSQWGNVFPMSVEGCRGAIQWLNTYEHLDVVALRNPQTDLELDDVPTYVASWVPVNQVVFCPRDRTRVGFYLTAPSGYLVAVATDPGRTLAICA